MIDEHGFIQHFLWRIRADQRDKSVEIVYQWMENYILSRYKAPLTSDYLGTAWYRLWRNVIEQNVIFITRNERGGLIKLASPTNL